MAHAAEAGSCGLNRLTNHPRLFSSAELAVAASLAQQRGRSDTFLVGDGVSRADLIDPTRRLPLACVLSGLRRAPDLIEILPSELHLSNYGFAGLALLSAASLFDALRFIEVRWPLFDMKFAIGLREGSETISLSFENRFRLSKEDHRLFLPLEIGKILTLIHDLMPDTAHLTKAPTISEHNCGEAIGSIEIPVLLAHAPLPQANLTAHRSVTASCDRMMDSLFQEPALVRRIKAQFATLEYGAPSLSAMAAHLCMSERTLRRRLQELGTSYGRLLGEVRMDMAEHYLRHDRATTDVIAARLGYAEATNFRHAFRRWTGSSPQSFRSQMGA